MSSESFAPPVVGKGRTGFLPPRLIVNGTLLEPYGGLFGEEWLESKMNPSTFADRRPLQDQEEIGTEIQRLVKEQGITASAAADIVLAK